MIKIIYALPVFVSEGAYVKQCSISDRDIPLLFLCPTLANYVEKLQYVNVYKHVWRRIFLSKPYVSQRLKLNFLVSTLVFTIRDF
jgi:hypothetical protein